MCAAKLLDAGADINAASKGGMKFKTQIISHSVVGLKGHDISPIQ